MTIAASGSSFSYSAAVAVAITTDVAAVAAAAMIAAAANSGFTIIHKRDIGQKGCPAVSYTHLTLPTNSRV